MENGQNHLSILRSPFAFLKENNTLNTSGGGVRSLNEWGGGLFPPFLSFFPHHCLLSPFSRFVCFRPICCPRPQSAGPEPEISARAFFLRSESVSQRFKDRIITPSAHLIPGGGFSARRPGGGLTSSPAPCVCWCTDFFPHVSSDAPVRAKVSKVSKASK